MKIKNLPAIERPLEKLERYGAGILSDSELLALLIGSGTRERSAVRVAEELLSLDNEGLRYLRVCAAEELAGVKGVGRMKAARICAAMELGRRSAVPKTEANDMICGTEDVVDHFMEKMRCFDREVFNVMMVNTKGGLLGVETVAVGDISSSIVHPRETFRTAVRKGAYGIVLVHNHPSGDPAPSKEDIEVTKRLREAGDILGIRVLDHVIIGDGRYTSMKADGYI